MVNLRITGTGLAYRSSIDEHVWRDPATYLNDEFLARCNGLSVIVNHPDDLILDDKEFEKRIVGAVMLPYIKSDEVWAICRVYSDEIVDEIRQGEVSTSPSVVFNRDSGNVIVSPEGSEESVLIEGKPYLIDHIALVTKEHGTRGVWDKNQAPSGIEITNQGEIEMSPEELKAALADVINPLTARMDAFQARADAADAKADADAKARADADEKAKADADEKAKADADEKARCDAEEKAKADADEEAKKKKDDKSDDDDEDKMEMAKADEQAKADSAYAACGKRARAPMTGESVQGYRKRMVKGLQAYSDAYKAVNIDAITDDVLLGIAERQVYADAAAFINSGADVPVGTLRPIRGVDSAGRTTVKFAGDVGAFLAPFKIESQQYAGRQVNR